MIHCPICASSSRMTSKQPKKSLRSQNNSCRSRSWLRKSTRLNTIKVKRKSKAWIKPQVGLIWGHFRIVQTKMSKLTATLPYRTLKYYKIIMIFSRSRIRSTGRRKAWRGKQRCRSNHRYPRWILCNPWVSNETSRMLSRVHSYRCSKSQVSELASRSNTASVSN